MEITVRKATLEDYDSALKLMDQVQMMHVSWRPDIYRETECILPLENYRSFVENDAFFVAEADGSVVGIMSLLFRHIENPAMVTRDIIYVDSMAVDENFRGQGVGHKFFEEIKRLKAEKKFDGIELSVNAMNKAAYEMYIKYGFTEKSINMELRQ